MAPKMATMQAWPLQQKRSFMRKLDKGRVFHGTKQKTDTGLEQSDLMKTETGRIVTKKAHAAGCKKYSYIIGWNTALKKARQVLGVTGFVSVKKGSPLYMKSRAIYIADKIGWDYDAKIDSFMNYTTGQLLPYRHLTAKLGLEYTEYTVKQVFVKRGVFSG